MQIILTEDVVGLGDIGEQVTVKPGYARNFLIPNGYAMEAGSTRAKVISHKMRQIEAKKKRMKTAAEEVAENMSKVVVNLSLRVGSAGKVFGSISNRDIADALKKQGIEIDRRRVLLSDAIKKVGDHHVDVKLHAEVRVPILVKIASAKATKEEEAQEALEARENVEVKAAEKTEEESDDKDSDAVSAEDASQAESGEPSESDKESE